MIVAIVPGVAIGHKITLVEPVPELSTLAGVLGSHFVDYLTRVKNNGVSVSVSVVNQLPVPSPDELTDKLSGGFAISASEFFEPRLLELCFTSWDLYGWSTIFGAGFLPFRWNVDRRLALRAELDAFVFHLYAIERDDVDYIMDTFPIVRRKDEAQYGEYRTKRLILEVYDRMTEAMASGEPYQTLLDPPPADPSLCHDPSTRPDWADLYAPRS